jgi:copper homeostasis protein (lipoprotein)
MQAMQLICSGAPRSSNRGSITIGLVALVGVMPTFFSSGLAFAQQAAKSKAVSVVTGTATYRERIALSSDSVFEATLEDVSRGDARAEVIGSVRLERPGPVPIRFEIPYDSARIDTRHSYAVRARILVRDRLMFTTDRVSPVLTRGHGAQVTLLLVRAGGGETPGSELLGSLPASFVGDLPCADCPGIRYQLDLFTDGAFFLRMTYLGRGDDARYDDIGRWAVSSEGRTLVLHGGREAPMMFAIQDHDRLRKLDVEGRPIASKLNYDLVRSAEAQPIEPRLAMRGMYRYMADAGLFTECLTGRTLPVAQVGDNAALESAYAKTRRHAGEELLVNLEGRIAPRPKMEGEGTQPSLVVDRFIGVWPDETCGARTTTTSLENTYWKLARLGEVPIRVATEQREPHLILKSESRRVSGSGGCNRLIGSYELAGGRLTFGQLATTQMACQEGMDTEAAFMVALETVRTWRIAGQHLEMFDDAGQLVARFEARALP